MTMPLNDQTTEKMILLAHNMFSYDYQKAKCFKDCESCHYVLNLNSGIQNISKNSTIPRHLY